MWGRPIASLEDMGYLRNTPTRVGKTLLERRNLSGFLETPPRVWGRLLTLSEEQVSYGNTPTRVGKTLLFNKRIARAYRNTPTRVGKTVLGR